MQPKQKIVVFFMFLCALGSVESLHAQFYNKDVKARIRVEKNSEFYSFYALAENLTPSDYNLRYEFMVFKSDENNNTAKSSQGNLFFLKANERVQLSSLTINYNVEGKVILALIIYDQNDKPIGQDRIELAEGGKTQLEDKPEQTAPVTNDQAAPQDGFVQKGLVVQKTITKSGRDFYRYFYAKYFNLEVNTPHNIYIEEAIARRRTTKITVKVEDKLVWQFFAQPRKEFLKQMSEVSFERSIAQLRILHKQDKQLTRY